MRRIWAVLDDVVLKSMSAWKWWVFCNNIGRTSDHRKSTLQYVSEREETTSNNTLGALDRRDIYLGDQDNLKNYSTTTCTWRTTGNSDANINVSTTSTIPSLWTTATPTPSSIINNSGNDFQNHSTNTRNIILVNPAICQQVSVTTLLPTQTLLIQVLPTPPAVPVVNTEEKYLNNNEADNDNADDEHGEWYKQDPLDSNWIRNKIIADERNGTH